MTPATFALYLAVLALAIHQLLGALQSGTFNDTLARFSLPPIPTRVFPWLGLGLGLAGGVVQALTQGDPLALAIAKTLSGGLTGNITALHAQFISGRDPVVRKTPPDPCRPDADSTLPPPSVKLPPTLSTLRRLTLAGGVVIVALVAFAPRPNRAAVEPTPLTAQGCAWFAANDKTLAVYSAQDASCVLTQLFAGIVDPAAILVACAPLTLEQVVAITTSLIDFYVAPNVAPGDAGAAAAAFSLTPAPPHCAPGSPPVRGAPSCIPHETLLRWMTFRVAAMAQIQAARK